MQLATCHDHSCVCCYMVHMQQQHLARSAALRLFVSVAGRTQVMLYGYLQSAHIHAAALTRKP